MTQDLPRDDLQTQVVTHAVRHHWRVLVLVTVLITLAVGAYVYVKPQSFKATATVLITPLIGNALSDDSTATTQSITVAMQTEAGVVTSEAVSSAASTSVHTTLKAGSKNLVAKVPSNTQLIEISYTARKAAGAQRDAQAYAVQFLAHRADLALATQKTRISGFTTQLNQAQTLLNQATKAAQSSSPPPDSTAKVQLYSSRVSSLETEIGQTQALSTQPGSVTTPAALPKSPVGISRILLVVAAFILGLVLGLLAAIWRERRDDRIRGTAEAMIEDLPVLAVIPSLRGGSKGGPPALLASAGDDAFRRARTGVRAAAALHSVVAVSPMSPAQPSAELAVRLAQALATAGYRTVVVDAVVDNPRVAALTGLKDAHGLSDLLISGDIDNIELAEFGGVGVLPAGTDPQAARERYSGADFSTLLAQLSRAADYVIVATSAAASADGLAVMLAVDSVALVAADRVTTYESVTQQSNLIRVLGVPVLGIFLVSPRKRAGKAEQSK